MISIPRRLKLWLYPSSGVAEPRFTPLYLNHAFTSTTNVADGGQVIPNAVTGQLTFNTMFTPNELRQVREQMSLFRRKPKTRPDPPPDLAPIRERLQEAIGELVGPDRHLSEVLYDLTTRIEKLEVVEAKEKALATLIEHLDEKQRQTFNSGNGYFDVAGKTMTYRLSMHAPIKVVDGPNKNTGFCIYSTDPRAPHADELLGLKLYIEGNEAGFLKTANPESQIQWYIDVDGKTRSRQTGRQVQAGTRLHTGLEWPALAARFNAGLTLNDYRQTFQQYQQQQQTLQQRLEALTAQLNQYRFELQRNVDPPLETTTFGDPTRTYVTNTATTLRGTGPDGTLIANTVDLDTRHPTFTFEPNRLGRMANHPAGPLDPAHCPDCTRIHGDLQRATEAWTG